MIWIPGELSEEAGRGGGRGGGWRRDATVTEPAHCRPGASLCICHHSHTHTHTHPSQASSCVAAEDAHGVDLVSVQAEPGPPSSSLGQPKAGKDASRHLLMLSALQPSPGKPVTEGKPSHVASVSSHSLITGLSHPRVSTGQQAQPLARQRGAQTSKEERAL